MPNFNQTILMGHLTKKPELQAIGANNTLVCQNVSLAVNSKYNGTEKTLFMPLKVWGKTAEALANYTDKGDAIQVVGELRQDEYTDKQGETKKAIYLNVDKLTIVKTKKDGQSSAGSSQTNNTATETNATETSEDDVPF